MGWIRGLHTQVVLTSAAQPPDSIRELKGSAEHVENVSDGSRPRDTTQDQDTHRVENKYQFQPEDMPDEQLPAIPREVVESKRQKKSIIEGSVPGSTRKDCWIVVDRIVYDCTGFISEHPGGEQVISSFVGEDCSCKLILPMLFIHISTLTRLVAQGNSGDSMERSKWLSTDESYGSAEQRESRIDSKSQCVTSGYLSLVVMSGRLICKVTARLIRCRSLP